MLGDPRWGNLQTTVTPFAFNIPCVPSREILNPKRGMIGAILCSDYAVSHYPANIKQALTYRTASQVNRYQPSNVCVCFWNTSKLHTKSSQWDKHWSHQPTADFMPCTSPTNNIELRSVFRTQDQFLLVATCKISYRNDTVLAFGYCSFCNTITACIPFS